MVFLLSLALFLPIVQAILVTNDSSLIAGRAFDYVIVGGGTAGLAIANRLSEIHSNTVLVIEAGLDQRNNSGINDPGQELLVYKGPEVDWLYSSTPQQNERVLQVLAGKCLGGSTCINNMMLSRGTVDQYNAWEELGNPTWNFKSVQNFMKKSEFFHVPNSNQTIAGARFDPTAHGMHGLVSTGFDNPLLNTEWLKAYSDTFLSAVPGLQNRSDFASGKPNGVSWFAWTIRPGPTSDIGGNRRSTAAVSYIYPFLNSRPNLAILVEHQASRILWDTKSLPRAVGVEFLPASGGSTSSVRVLKEVISSASTVGSPRFLELSGIGNRTILENAGVEVVVDLPAIGTNFQDQPAAAASYAMLANASNITARNVVFCACSPDPNGNGALASAAFLDLEQILGQEALNFSETLVRTIPQRAAEVVRQGGFTSVEGLKNIYRIQAASNIHSHAPVIEMLGGVSPALRGATIVNTVLIPTTRGTVHIVSSDPLVPPAINPMMFTTDLDLFLVTRAIQMTRRLVETAPMSNFLGSSSSPTLQDVPVNATDEVWRTWILSNYRSAAHPIGTVPMLPRDMGGAVDANLRVYGTANVRVADASIMPTHISAHTSSSCYGIGEKAADIILRGL